jgi:hypothetical protein
MKHNIGKLYNALIKERGYDPITFRHSLVDDPTGTALYSDYKSGLGEFFDTGLLRDGEYSEKTGMKKLYESLVNIMFKENK